MKRVIIAMLVMLALVCSASNVMAKGIGIKGGYAWMQDDYENRGGYNYKDNWTFGVFFDLDSFVFNSLIFRPGVDYIELENRENSQVTTDLWALHIDWYWFFMGKSKIAPFIGFGPTLNYYKYNNHHIGEKDSDAGLELFGGCDIGLTGSVSLTLEARFVMNDIANRDQNMAKVLVGVLFAF